MLLDPMPVPSGVTPMPHHASSGHAGWVAAPTSSPAAPTPTPATSTSAMGDVSDCVVCYISAAATTTASGTSTAALVHMRAAPALLSLRPPEFEVGKAGVAVVGQALGATTAMDGNPRPVAIHLHSLPNHAKARVDGRRAGTFTALALLRATPLLFRGRPSPEKIVQGRIAVEGRRSGHMNDAACFFNGAGTAHVAVHLHLAVRQGTSIAPALEKMILGPLQAIRTGGSLAIVGARGVALQWRQRGFGAAFLEVAAAPLTLPRGPIRNLPVTMMRNAATMMPLTTPGLL